MIVLQRSDLSDRSDKRGNSGFVENTFSPTKKQSREFDAGIIARSGIIVTDRP